MAISKILSIIKKRKIRKEWRKRNSHNSTVVSEYYPETLVKIGSSTYGQINIDSYGMPEEYLSIGSFCSIASNVVFLTGGGHYLDRFTTFPLERKLCGIKEETTKGHVIIEDDVWIGYGATILSGVHVGRGAVIGACSVVAKNIPPYAIVVGNPAQIIKYRFEKNIIKKLLQVDFTKLASIDKKEMIDLYRTDVNNIDFSEFY